jgi:hypothetical protein
MMCDRDVVMMMASLRLEGDGGDAQIPSSGRAGRPWRLLTTRSPGAGLGDAL